MFDIEKGFYDVKKKLPEENQRVIAYNSKMDDFISAVFKNGKFYENNIELINITRWCENNSSIEF
jgi:hypothetical protein